MAVDAKYQNADKQLVAAKFACELIVGKNYDQAHCRDAARHYRSKTYEDYKESEEHRKAHTQSCSQR